MRAARLHKVATPLVIDEIDTPSPLGSDVLVKVHACGIVPNLHNVINHYPEWFPDLPLPKLPSIYGLDAAGVVDKVGPNVAGVRVGQRVYVNPLRGCGGCNPCRRNQIVLCQNFILAGYFGMGADAGRQFERYPWGGFAEYLIAPVDSLVTLPDSVSFETASRFGYLGTSYAALRKVAAGPSTAVLINGATGTLGVGATLLALALGVPKILAVARNRSLLERIRLLAPSRITTFSPDDGPIAPRVFAATDGMGADCAIDALGANAAPEATLDALMSLGRGGRMAIIGGMADTIQFAPIYLMTRALSLIGSDWFTTEQGQEMADMAGAGVLDMSSLEYTRFPLDLVNEAIQAARGRPAGGFDNIVVQPQE